MNAFAVVSPQELTVAPDPRVRVCPFCYETEEKAALEARRVFLRANTRFALTDGWKCTGCDRKVVIHHQTEPCEKCAMPAPTRYYANRRQSFCPCRFTAEEQEAISIREVEQERAKAVAQRKAAEAELDRIRDQRQAEADRTRAAACWKGRNHDCKIPKANLLPFCGQCARFSPSARKDPT